MNSSAYLVFAILAIAQLGFCDEVNYKDCGSAIGSVNKVSVSGCNKDMSRCILKRNTNATVDIEFVANENSNALKSVVHGVVMDVPVPFDLPNDNACSNSGIECPISSGSTYSYLATLPVLKKYPRVTVDIKWELKKDGSDFVCILIPAKLQ
ncbi:PREDICTED: ecdysteroid-regulated 16 kDa protein-like [Nicrophorus vespilloides]|uniref:Ecdysteroid-regulated 16 kDa protein-like n=1 Tax=Nicrophorus vespilloides TaxID=110193 RepID=A0ABM1NIG5_NICVS|nr:PREDICTED: ecdysteroid-regulated 16 kDa protein-like [Nicrophorus vespilloides]